MSAAHHDDISADSLNDRRTVLPSRRASGLRWGAPVALLTNTAAPPAAAKAPLMAARRLYPGIESSGLFFMIDEELG